MHSLNTRIARIIGVWACALVPLCGAAQAFPDRPVTLVLAYSAGSISDVLARSVAQQLSARWKQPVLVDNRPGGNQIIAASLVAKAAADGYTLLLCDDGVFTLNPHLFRKLPYSLEDFAPVADLAQLQMVLSSGQVPAASIAELVALARARPGTLNYGSFGTGNIVHLAMDAFSRMAAIELVHVPYKGYPDAIRDVLANQVQLVLGGIGGPALQYLKSGAMRPLAVTGPSRSPLLPDVPTLAEAGFARLDPQVNFILMAPAGTPPAVVRKINAAAAVIVRQEIAATVLAPNGMRPLGASPDALAASLRQGGAAYAELVKSSGVRLD
ncbi:Bug family tripartite tricarboxylate transporter substrate binding protein [Delftia acidovorans]|uniref:Bug family tripartite tricarboxylate transporter substrate binding protein n=1 Tax=Delftia acidovorans TaxID=80866 RepID=UPI00286ED5A9|nr:tripartite tricarboxylate transporter substrate binding protein [Delftia acidovorans]